MAATYHRMRVAPGPRGVAGAEDAPPTPPTTAVVNGSATGDARPGSPAAAEETTGAAAAAADGWTDIAYHPSSLVTCSTTEVAAEGDSSSPEDEEGEDEEGGTDSTDEDDDRYYPLDCYVPTDWYVVPGPHLPDSDSGSDSDFDSESDLGDADADVDTDTDAVVVRGRVSAVGSDAGTPRVRSNGGGARGGREALPSRSALSASLASGWQQLLLEPASRGLNPNPPLDSGEGGWVINPLVPAPAGLRRGTASPWSLNEGEDVAGRVNGGGRINGGGEVDDGEVAIAVEWTYEQGGYEEEEGEWDKLRGSDGEVGKYEPLEWFRPADTRGPSGEWVPAVGSIGGLLSADRSVEPSQGDGTIDGSGSGGGGGGGGGWDVQSYTLSISTVGSDAAGGMDGFDEDSFGVSSSFCSSRSDNGDGDGDGDGNNDGSGEEVAGEEEAVGSDEGGTTDGYEALVWTSGQAAGRVRTVWSLLAEARAAFGSRLAVVEGEAEWSYGALHEAARR
eukprot:1179073-Prorocentrum_minimum.AAC.4